MRKFLVGVSAAFAVVAIATPAWAPHGCPGGCPNKNRASTAAATAHAAPKHCHATKTHACPHYYRRGYWVRH